MRGNGIVSQLVPCRESEWFALCSLHGVTEGSQGLLLLALDLRQGLLPRSETGCGGASQTRYDKWSISCLISNRGCQSHQ